MTARSITQHLAVAVILTTTIVLTLTLAALSGPAPELVVAP
ncbi:hypothetical protein [Kocuria rosea]|nr:hypothetical protein [Kocuria rosea]